MCTDCITQLNNTLKFRKQCQKVETELLRIQSELETSSFIVTNEFTLKLKKNISKIKMTQNCSNVTMIETENMFTDFKMEPTDIDEDKPLKFFVNTETLNTTLLRNNDVNIRQNKNILSKEPLTEIHTEYFDEESNFSEEKLNTEEIFSNIDIGCENTNTDSFNCIIYQKPLGNKATKIKQTKKLLRCNDRIKLNNTEESYEEEASQSKSSEDLHKTSEVPYSFITDSVTKKTTRVVCKLCQKELSIRSIDSHMARRHPGADERKVKCELCDKYVMRERMNRHKMMMHGSAGFRCGVSNLYLFQGPPIKEEKFISNINLI